MYYKNFFVFKSLSLSCHHQVFLNSLLSEQDVELITPPMYCYYINILKCKFFVYYDVLLI